MSTNLRLLLHKKISKALPKEKPFKSSTVARHLRLKHEKSNKKFLFALPLRSKYHDIREDVPNLLKRDSELFLENIEIDKNNPEEITFQLCKEQYVKQLFDSLRHNVIAPEFMCEKSENILVEFSSPNIAKPFHVGHLRSTMIGNFVANMNDFFKHSTKRINYLGDWGTQFGFVQLGLTLENVTEESLKKDPINTLYNAYVLANKLSEQDPTIAIQARELFRDLERGDENSIFKWQSFRQYTVEELHRTYDRIGVKFDKYEWESMYNIKKISNIISQMERLNLIVTDSQDRKVIHLNEKKIVPIIKSDGSSLYITRDIAAAINRFEEYKFNTMYYVVDNTQTDHFINLIDILNAMELPWADRLKHVKFGKIKGMSTRKGTVVFLQDILNETQIVMKEKQICNPNTKVNLDYNDPSTEVLGLSAIIINDLKHKRNQDYIFDWDVALNRKGITGINLQYSHCRLCSLEENSGAQVASECIPSLLTEASAEDLIYCIGKFDEAVIKSFQELEPYILVNYLFELSHVTNKALKVLKVKGESTELANQRLLLFHTARKVLSQGMKLLGVTPLNKM